MIKKKIKGDLIIISGPSGCGKGTICKELIKNNDNLVISTSATTRSPRNGEVDGIDYYFITKKEFEEKIKNNEFLEFAKVHHDNYYGTLKNKVLDNINKGIDVILEIDIEGALQINTTMPEAIFIFIMPPSMRELKKRLIKRNTETKDQIIDRFKKAYQEINAASKYNYVIINDEISSAVNKIKSIIEAEKCRVDRIEDFDLNTKEELMHELLMDLKEYKK